MELYDFAMEFYDFDRNLCIQTTFVLQTVEMRLESIIRLLLTHHTFGTALLSSETLSLTVLSD